MKARNAKTTLLLTLATATLVGTQLNTCAETIYAAGTAAGPSGDAPGLANSDGSVTSVGSWELWVGGANWVSSGNVQTAVIMGFQLPSLGAVSDPFATANLGVNFFAKDNNPTTFNVDLYGLGLRSSSTIVASDYFGGALDSTSGVTLLMDNMITPTTPMQTVDGPVGTFSENIASYLNDLYADGANAGQYVIFRFSADVTGLESENDLVYKLETNPGNGVPFDLPQITFSVVPEPSSLALIGLASAAMIFRKRGRHF